MRARLWDAVVVAALVVPPFVLGLLMPYGAVGVR